MSKPTMRVYHDWEFEERSGFIDVISAGFVREDGQELYVVFNDFDTLSVARNEWLMKNVMPSIGHEETTSHTAGTGQPVKDLYINDTAAMSKRLARIRIKSFVEDIVPEWWAWYGAYDHVALCSLFGRMIDLPEDWPMLTHDLKTLVKLAGNPEMPKQPTGHHNALEDARFNKVRYDFLMDKLEPKTQTWVIAESAASISAARRWLSNSKVQNVHLIFHADRLRGQTIRTTDVVVSFGELSEEMLANLKLARR